MTLYFGVGQKKSINVGRFSIEILHKVSKPLVMRTKTKRSTGNALKCSKVNLFLFAQKYTK